MLCWHKRLRVRNMVILQTWGVVIQVLVYIDCTFQNSSASETALIETQSYHMFYEIEKGQWLFFKKYLEKTPTVRSRQDSHRGLSSVQTRFPGSLLVPIGILLWSPWFRWTKVVSTTKAAKLNWVSQRSTYLHDGESAEWALTLDFWFTGNFKKGSQDR